ncbi:MAG TPA: translation initiation factor IF-2, partial [Deltaproteobacteria bacterium]|nr:translation initiation factor IF-2 [Deltaproteobacteria bacterium]
DGVMPQTIEAIHHAKAAGVPIIVAVNKIDKPEAQPDNVKRQLSEQGLQAEDWGGDTLFVPVSAKSKMGIEQLLESIFLQSEMLELKANPNKLAKGVIIEARLEKGRGPVATVLVQEGTLKVGDNVVSGLASGRVRAMNNDRGESVESAAPGLPVEVLGLDGVPLASEPLQAVEDEKIAKQVVEHRQLKAREQKWAGPGKMSLEDLFSKLKSGETKELALILKADVQGSLEAVQTALEKLSGEQVRVHVLHSGVGGITESDVMLASASNAVILGFHVRPDTQARGIAEQEGVEIKIYQVIYDAVEDIKKAMEGLLEPTIKEKYLGRAEVREVFNISKVGNVAGCYVIDGKLQRNAQIRLLRDNVILYTGKLSSLKRFKDDAREVEKGYECGLGIDGYNDIKVGDVVECFIVETVKTKLPA